LIYYLVKIAITSILIVTISEIAKRSTFLGALLASLPLISVFAMLWLYIDTKDVARVGTFATSVFWLVLLWHYHCYWSKVCTFISALVFRLG